MTTDRFVRPNSQFAVGANQGQFIPPKTRDYGRQYAGMYWYRLEALKPRLLLAAQRRWSASNPDAVYVDKLLEITAGTLCYAVGTVYMHMPLKPNVLEQLEQDLEIAVPPVSDSKYCGSPEDQVYLEDHTGRIQLTGNALLKQGLIVTGMAIAVLGRESPLGSFEVEDICFMGMAPQLQRLIAISDDTSRDKFVLLLSGLQISRETNTFDLQLLADFICGQVGEPDDIVSTTSQIVRVVIAGNSVIMSMGDVGFESSPTDPLCVFDSFLEQIGLSVPVDLLPGRLDPAGYMWPQQPLHKALLPRSKCLSNFTSHTNPCQFNLDGTEILGTSGVNISDMCRYSEKADGLQAAELSFNCQHIAPTAPDTLNCFPYSLTDPFIIEETPHVYFAGNQKEFATKMVQNESGTAVRIIMIPSFQETKTAILLNLRSLDCFPLTIS